MSSIRREYRSLTIKIVIVGDPTVGKTSLRKRYMGEGFQTSYLPTLGADFAIQKLKIDERLEVQVRIWDLAGQKTFKKIRKHYFENTKGVLLVFDLSRYDTFANLNGWFQEIFELTMFPINNIPILLIGNKSDLEPLQVPPDEIQQLIDSLIAKGGNIRYIQTSAKTGDNVPVAFESICHQIVESIRID